MSYKKILTSLLSICVLSSIAIASGPIVSLEKKRVPAKPIILEENRKQESQRPHVPSKQRISLDYDGEYLTFGFVVPEGECDVVLTEWYSGAVQTYTIDSTPLSAEIYVGELYESTVTITTAKDNTYTAELTAEEE